MSSSVGNNPLRLLRLVLLCLALGGCVPSLHRLYDTKSLAFSPALLGAWRSGDGSVHFLFTHARAPGLYRMVYVSGDQPPVPFRAALLRLHGTTYLDLTPRLPRAMKGPGFLQLHTLLWHSFARVSLTGNRLALHLADPGWLGAWLSRYPAALAHFSNRGLIYLTADTAALQRFVAEHPAMFATKATVFTRP